MSEQGTRQSVQQKKDLATTFIVPTGANPDLRKRADEDPENVYLKH